MTQHAIFAIRTVCTTLKVNILWEGTVGYDEQMKIFISHSHGYDCIYANNSILYSVEFKLCMLLVNSNERYKSAQSSTSSGHSSLILWLTDFFPKKLGRRKKKIWILRQKINKPP